MPYLYRILSDPTENELTDLGLGGWRVIKVNWRAQYDPKCAVYMELEIGIEAAERIKKERVFNTFTVEQEKESQRGNSNWATTPESQHATLEEIRDERNREMWRAFLDSRDDPNNLDDETDDAPVNDYKRLDLP